MKLQIILYPSTILDALVLKVVFVLKGNAVTRDPDASKEEGCKVQPFQYMCFRLYAGSRSI